MMNLNRYESGELFPDLAFFSEDTSFLGRQMRPLSLATFKAMKHMQLTVMDEEHELDLKQETKEIGAFVWLHSAAIPDICSALWSGAWRAVLDEFEEPIPGVIEQFRAWRIRIIACLKASDIDLRPRPRPEKDDTPIDVVGPAAFAFTVGHIAHFTGLTTDHVKWHLFLPEALQYFHVAMRWHGAWTVRPGREVNETDFVDLLPDFMKPKPATDGEGIDTPGQT